MCKFEILFKQLVVVRQLYDWPVSGNSYYLNINLASFKSRNMHQTEQPSNITLETNAKQTVPANINKYTAISSMLFIFITSLATYLHYSRRDQPFKPYIDTSSFYPEQNPKIYAGQVHYSRIPVEYWEHRIMMIKSMGLNALSVYIMWNYHEIQRGRFDFETDNKNLSYFLELAEKHQMKVLIRPGPYVCAEWDFGGLPSRLLADKELQIRSINKRFMEEVEIYFTAVAPIIKKHLWTQQNPTRCIIMLQIENQYGFFGTDIDYILGIRKLWRKLNVHTAEYYVDWFINVRKSHWKGANIGLNDAFTQIEIDYIKTTLQPKGLIFGGQIYSGWLTFWHMDKFDSKDPYEKVKQFEFLMSHNLSYSMYMAHGGTSFGLTAGANSRYVEELGFAGQLTSYDYDAPISEQGAATKKYHVFRDSISKYASWQVPDIPAPIPMTTIRPFKPTVIASIFDNINWTSPTSTSNKPAVYQSEELKMFNLGLVIYQIVLPAKFKDTFTIVGHDLVFITIDGKFYQLLDRTLQKHANVTLQCQSTSSCTVRFLVEAMGHINYDLSMKEDFKGIVTFKSNTNQDQQFEWKMYTVPIHDKKLLEWKSIGSNLMDMPVLLRTTFELEKPADTYLNMKKYTKGYIWVNGRNLGRFWNVGPQFKLFCPGVWLKNGTNEVHVLDLKYSGEHYIQGQLTLNEKQSDF